MTSPHHFLAEMIDREIAAGAQMDESGAFLTVGGTAFGETALTTAGMQYARARLVDDATAKVAAGTHALVYRGLDGETYRARYRKHEWGVGYLDVRRADGAPFEYQGRTVRKAQPMTRPSEVAQLVDSTFRDPSAAARLESVA